jgi:hypothetical protein
VVPGGEDERDPAKESKLSHPDYFECHVPRELVEKYQDWTECVAFKFVIVDGDSCEVWVTNDLEQLTDPESGS